MSAIVVILSWMLKAALPVLAVGSLAVAPRRPASSARAHCLEGHLWTWLAAGSGCLMIPMQL
jgi:hypothetical protein